MILGLPYFYPPNSPAKRWCSQIFLTLLLPFSLLFLITSVPMVGIVLLSSRTLHMGPGNQDPHRHAKSFWNSRINPNTIVFVHTWASVFRTSIEFGLCKLLEIYATRFGSKSHAREFSQAFPNHENSDAQLSSVKSNFRFLFPIYSISVFHTKLEALFVEWACEL